MKLRAPGRVAHSLICTSYNEHTSEREKNVTREIAPMEFLFVSFKVSSNLN